MKYLLYTLGAAAAYLGIAAAVDLILMGLVHRSAAQPAAQPAAQSDAPTPRPNRIDRQQGNSCGGYSAAYLLRSYGVEADGMEVYRTLRLKSPRGNVPPRSVIRALRLHGLECELRTGSVDTLRREVRHAPVIAFMRSRPHGSGLHFACVVGFDGEEVLLADSARDWNGRSPFNRRLPLAEFERLWNTRSPVRPLFTNLYIAAK